MEHIPELAEGILINQVENEVFYVVYQPETDFRLKVNELTRTLLALIDGKKNITELTRALNDRSGNEVSTQQINQLIKETLEPCGIIKSAIAIIPKDRAPYLRLRMTLIPGSIVSKIADALKFLLPNNPWPLILLLSGLVSMIYLFTLSIAGLTNFITPENILFYMPLSLFSRIVHEFGHASACEKFKIKAGNIGFGFYLFVPVFYADVSNAWCITPRKRIIINAAGMYFQLLLSCALILFYFITFNHWLLYASLVNILSFLPNINPFVRYDGYWILSDWLGVNNLMMKAREKYQDTFKWLSTKFKEPSPLKSKTDTFLFIYFLSSRAMIAVFIVYAFWPSPNAIVFFPKRLLAFVQANSIDGFSFEGLKQFVLNNFLSLLFFTLLAGLAKKWFQRSLAKKETDASLE